jgi:AcrR family transcriptional regulator
MSRPVKTPSSPDYRAKIGTVAEALFAERGFDGTSLREIAERTGVTKALIYHYYENKEGLYQAILEDAASDVVTRVEEITENGEEPETQIRAVVQVFLDAHHDAPHRFQMIQRTIDDHHSIAAVLAERWFSRAHLALQAIVAEGVRQGGFKPLPAQMVPFAIIGLIVHTLRGQKLVSHIDPNLSGEQVLTALPDLVLALLTADSGQRKIRPSSALRSRRRSPSQAKRRAKG